MTYPDDDDRHEHPIEDGEPILVSTTRPPRTEFLRGVKACIDHGHYLSIVDVPEAEAEAAAPDARLRKAAKRVVDESRFSDEGRANFPPSGRSIEALRDALAAHRSSDPSPAYKVGSDDPE